MNSLTQLTLEKEEWIIGQIRPCPEVFILAWAGTSHCEWKMVEMCSEVEYQKVDDWLGVAKRKFPSAKIIRVFRIAKP